MANRPPLLPQRHSDSPASFVTEKSRALTVQRFSLDRKTALPASKGHSWSRVVDLSRSPALVISILVGLCWLANQPPFNQCDAAIFLSYSLSEGTKTLLSQTVYGTGMKDLVFVVFYATLMMAFRTVFVDKLYLRLARLVKAVPRRRFAEQMFQFTYFLMSTALGVYVSINVGVWQLTPADLVSRIQADDLSGHVKLLYLVETAWWLHEAAALILGREKQRKDFLELACHHVVALVLILGSYWYSFRDFGLMIMVPHGASDALLAVAKMSTYTKSRFTTPAWLIFVAVWLYCRHYLMIRAIISAGLTFKHGLAPDSASLPYMVCMVCLVVLQMLNLFWLCLIVKGMRKASESKASYDDIRSDDEADSE